MIHSRSLVILLCSALPFVVPTAANAQRLVPVLPTRVTGSIQQISPPHSFAEIDSVQRTRGHAVTGLVIGAVVGFVAGAVLFSASSNACTGSGDYKKNCYLYRAGIVIGAAGLGALIGSRIRTRESRSQR